MALATSLKEICAVLALLSVEGMDGLLDGLERLIQILNGINLGEKTSNSLGYFNDLRARRRVLGTLCGESGSLQTTKDRDNSLIILGRA
jgi:hypothetical protein